MPESNPPQPPIDLQTVQLSTMPFVENQQGHLGSWEVKFPEESAIPPITLRYRIEGEPFLLTKPLFSLKLILPKKPEDKFAYNGFVAIQPDEHLNPEGVKPMFHTAVGILFRNRLVVSGKDQIPQVFPQIQPDLIETAVTRSHLAMTDKLSYVPDSSWYVPFLRKSRTGVSGEFRDPPAQKIRQFMQRAADSDVIIRPKDPAKPELTFEVRKLIHGIYYISGASLTLSGSIITLMDTKGQIGKCDVPEDTWSIGYGHAFKSKVAPEETWPDFVKE